MQISKFTQKEKELLMSLSSLITQYGFMEVLSLLETLAQSNVDLTGEKWEIIRKNLEASVIEMEEWNLSNSLN